MTPGALLRYRVMAFTTGVLLLVLLFVAEPVKIWGGDASWVSRVGFVHGWAYALYVLAALWLAYRGRWSLVRTILVALAGTIPFASFVAERAVVRRVRQETAAAPGPRVPV